MGGARMRPTLPSRSCGRHHFWGKPAAPLHELRIHVWLAPMEPPGSRIVRSWTAHSFTSRELDPPMSLFSLSRWRPAHLFLSWLVYWVALLAVTLGPAIPATLRATAPKAHGEISASFGSSVWSLIIRRSGQLLWSGSVHTVTAALWIAIPPLILWLLWLAGRGTATRQPAGIGREA